MRNNVANKLVSLNHHRNNPAADAGACSAEVIRIYRTWFFWGFILIPVAVVISWTQYMSVQAPYAAMPWLNINTGQHAGHWNEWVRYYIWLQLVWLPANMVLFLIWCALGVRIWNCKRQAQLH